MARLVEITRENWQECIKLPTGKDHERFVRTNLYSLAQAQFCPESSIRCIYADEEMVGCTMYGPDEHRGDLFWVYRLMIAENKRGQGFGRNGLALVAEEARKLGYSRIGLSADPENRSAIQLYESVGFKATNEREGCEVVYICDITEEGWAVP